MIVVEFEGTRAAKVVRQIEQDFYAKVPKIGRLKLRNFLERIRVQMRGEGKQIKYPVRWDSAKQRRAFFATDGFGGGIPHRRTNAYRLGWEVLDTEKGFVLTNQTDGSKYIAGDAYGIDQSRIHQGRWKLFKDVVESEFDKLPEEMQRAVYRIARAVVRNENAEAV